MPTTPPPDDFPRERVTQMPCPARGCEAGDVITRAEDGLGGYFVGRRVCAYCQGTGTVTPERYAAWRKIERLTR